MVCKPINAKADSEKIARQLFPERMVGDPNISGYVSDADAGQRLFAQQIIEHLIKHGAVFPWGIDKVKPMPAPGESNE